MFGSVVAVLSAVIQACSRECVYTLTIQCPLHVQELVAAMTGLEMVLPCLKAVVPLDQAFHKAQVPGSM